MLIDAPPHSIYLFVPALRRLLSKSRQWILFLPPLFPSCLYPLRICLHLLLIFLLENRATRLCCIVLRLVFFFTAILRFFQVRHGSAHEARALDPLTSVLTVLFPRTSRFHGVLQVEGNFFVSSPVVFPPYPGNLPFTPFDSPPAFKN